MRQYIECHNVTSCARGFRVEGRRGTAAEWLDPARAGWRRPGSHSALGVSRPLQRRAQSPTARVGPLGPRRSWLPPRTIFTVCLAFSRYVLTTFLISVTT